jgi:hypothetical protein
MSLGRLASGLALASGAAEAGSALKSCASIGALPGFRPPVRRSP